MQARITEGSGRAICLVCHQKILKEQEQVVVEHHFYHVSGRIHRKPEECKIEGKQ